MCPELEEERRRFFTGTVTVNNMVTHPDECRKMLSSKIVELKIDEDQNTIEVAQEYVVHQ